MECQMSRVSFLAEFDHFVFIKIFHLGLLRLVSFGKQCFWTFYKLHKMSRLWLTMSEGLILLHTLGWCIQTNPMLLVSSAGLFPHVDFLHLWIFSWALKNKSIMIYMILWNLITYSCYRILKYLITIFRLNKP